MGFNPVIELCYGMSFQSLRWRLCESLAEPVLTFRNRTGLLCPIGPIGWNSAVDQLNAAQSGALASNLHHEVVEYLVPQIKRRKIPETSFKYLNLQISSNDICGLCARPAIDIGPGSPDDFEKDIRKTLEAVRLGIREYPRLTDLKCT